ncbi:MAG: nucleotidyltransferase family protein [Bacteroidota bacterium]|nr:nucleotidyltransferase family protein [Bacteroidota bacterium]
MTNLELFYFIGRCLAMDNNSENKLRVMDTIQQDGVSWNRFVAMADGQLILPALYLSFKRNGVLPLLPEELAQHLAYIHQLNTERNGAIQEQIDEIQQLLTQEGIEPIFLKGAGNLLDNLYNDPGERMMGDIDFLVSEDDYIKAAKILISKAGYNHGNYAPGVEHMTHHYPRLAKAGAHADVEVHRLLVPGKASRYFNYEKVYPERKACGDKGQYYVLADKHNVVENFLHGFIAEGAAYSMLSLKTLYDLYLLSERTDILSTLKEFNHYNGKARAYLKIMYNVFAIKNDEALKSTWHYQSYMFRFRLYMKSRFWYKMLWTPYYVAERFNESYIGSFIGVFTNKNMRASVIARLKDPKWYFLHLKSYKETFDRFVGQPKR